MLFYSRGNLSLRWAVRAILTCGCAIVACMVLKETAFPRLAEEAGGTGLPAWLSQLKPYLPLVPIPGLILGIAALVMKPLRSPLAFLAMLATLLAVAAVVGTLILSMAPLYRVPEDLLGP